MEVSGQFHASTALIPGKEHEVLTCRRLGGPKSQSWHFGDEENCHEWTL